MPGSRLSHVYAMADAVYTAAGVLDRLARQKRLPTPVSRGATLRPGLGTPLWRTLAAAIRPLLKRRGAKALLAAELGLHRGRITDFFVTGKAMPDAERTLLLLHWYNRQRLVLARLRK